MKCRVCSEHIEQRWFDHILNKELLAKQLCFYCLYWWERVEWRANNDYTSLGERVVRVSGEHYLIVPNSINDFARGYGGAKFVIQFHTGERVVTTNLWHQGTIPEHFKEALPDNAVFVSSDEL